MSDFRQSLARRLDRAHRGAEVPGQRADMARALPSRRGAARERLMVVRGRLLLGGG